MTCEGFERELAAVMGDELPAEERARVLQGLLSHAEVCGAGCAGTRDLIELLASEPQDRDLVPEPGTYYWDTFNARLTERLASEDGSPGRHRVRWAVAASIAVLLVGGAWWWTRDGGGGHSSDPLAEQVLPPVELSPELLELLERTAPEAALADLAPLAGLVPGWGSEQAEDDGIADAISVILDEHVVGGTLDVIEDELVWDELSGYGPIFPETGELDPSLRRQLLEWLEQQTEGVS
jgi:hypothetical protein